MALVQRLIDQGARQITVRGRFMSTVRTFMDRAETTLEASGRTCFRVQGTAQLTSVPLSSLSLAGLHPMKESRGAAAVADLSEQLRKRLPRHGVLLVDAIGAVDELSFGILSATAERHQIPLIAGDIRPGGLTAFGDRSLVAGIPYVVDLGPLGFREIEQLITARLQGPVDEATMSEIYAMSGGYGEMAIAVAEAARADGKLRLTGGVWHACGALWSPLLVDLVAELLSEVDGRDRDILALLSISTIADRTALVSTIPADVLERLDLRGLIECRVIDGETTLVVSPPMLAEYFRHQLAPLARRRLAQTLQNQNVTPIVGSMADTVPDADGVDAIAVRVVHEVIAARKAVARADFMAEPTVGHALAYLRMLMSGRPEWDDIAELMRLVGPVTHDENGARLLGLSAYAHAFVLHQRDDALLLLDHGRETFPPEIAPVFAVAQAEIELRGGNLDAALALLEVDTSSSPAFVRNAVCEMSAYLHVGRGDFPSARAALNRLDRDAGSCTTRRADAEVLTLIGEGRCVHAETIARRAFADARSAADPVGLWRATYAVGAVQLVQGRFDGTVPLLNSIIALGAPPPQCEPEASAVFTAAEVVAARTGKTLSPLVRDRGRTLRARVQGLFPGMSGEWLDVHATEDRAPDGEPTLVVWEAARSVYERGGRFSALMTMTTALGNDPVPALVEELHTLFPAGTSPFVDACVDYVDAVASRSPDAVFPAASRLRDVGRFGLAYDLYSRAIDWAVEGGDAAMGVRARLLRADLEITAKADFGAIRLRERLLTLTERESEVAALIATGASNNDIGIHLGISTRTAETHVYRVMRKLGALERGDVIRLLAAQQQSQ